MKTLNIWEVRAEAGRKEPFLDVSENVMAENFMEALNTLMTLIEEKVEAFKDSADIAITVAHYKVTCVRLVQQVRTL